MAMGLINASFDRSTPTYRPVSIDTHWQTTHKFIFRDYEIEYTEFGKANSEKSHVSFDDLIRLGTSKLGAKEIRQGALGLEWVAGFHPCQWAPLPDNPDPLDAARAVTVDAKKWFLAQIRKTGLQLSEDNLALLGDNEKGPLKLIPVLLLPDGSHVSAPEELVERATQQLKNETN